MKRLRLNYEDIENTHEQKAYSNVKKNANNQQDTQNTQNKTIYIIYNK